MNQKQAKVNAFSRYEFETIRNLLMDGDTFMIVYMRAGFHGIPKSRAKCLVNLLVEFEWARTKGEFVVFDLVRRFEDNCDEWESFISGFLE